MKTLGMDTLLIDPTYKAKLLDAICTTHNTLCGNYKQFANKAACMAFMQGQPAPPVHRLAGNNFWCR